MELFLEEQRLAFAQYIFTAGAVSAGDKENYSCKLLFPKTNKKLHAHLLQVEEDVARAKWPTLSDEKLEKRLEVIRANGDGLVKDGDLKPDWAGFEDNWYINTSRRSEQGKPTIIDRNQSPLSAGDGKPYAGCYVNGHVDVWVQDNTFGKKLNAELLGLQFVRDGDAFGGGKPASKPSAFPKLGVDNGDDDPMLD